MNNLSFDDRCKAAYSIAAKSKTWIVAMQRIVDQGLAENVAEADELIREWEEKEAR